VRVLEKESDINVASRSEKDLISSTAMHGVIFVLASSCSSRSLNPRLMTLANMRRLLFVPNLDSAGRYSVLSSRLNYLGFPLKIFPLNIGESKGDRREGGLMSVTSRRIGSSTEGMYPRELESLAHRVIVSASRRHFERRQHEQVFYSTPAEIAHCLAYESKSKITKKTSSDADEVSWSSICGLFSAKQKILSVLQHPIVFRRLIRLQPIKMSKAVLLFGPPGNGKTCLAKATAKKCGYVLMSVKGPELLNKYIGSSEKAVRDLFHKAIALKRPCLIFFDEFEAIAAKRGKDNSGVTDRVVNQLLTFLDGAEEVKGNSSDGREENSQIFIIAATSRPDLVDPALLRPGRVETHVYIGPPENASERKEILVKSLIACGQKYHNIGDMIERSDIDEATSVVLDKMSSHNLCSKLSAVDLRSVISSAYLSAVNDFLIEEQKHSNHNPEGKSRSTLSNSSSRKPIIVTEKILWNAFLVTRPSVGEDEMAFYDSINSHFCRSEKP
jgi:SpoVK/Ycf46/Vps4 family AAA+-type ATPase